MGIIRNGILGGFKNKVGNIVGSSWRTLDVIKAYPKKSSKPPTQAQQDQQAKFKLVTDAITPLASVIDVGFKAYSSVQTPRNAAFTANFQTAVTGVSSNFSFDYEKLQFSKGSLENARDAQITTVTGSKIKYSWADVFNDAKERPTDLVTLVVYCPSLDKWVKLQNAAPRSAKTFTLQMPAGMMGNPVMCYISFVSTTTKNLASGTLYIGTLTAI
ncbi:DUF6266 family protein [Pedobacter duraquae]|uniref:Uncharacterized protein n=1 Tax=Pedobacter duraquae TaxID=425511 RepID=A0A4R6IQB1_9SPHI|nr:DUF6266 family protein [Pedobacter duraquae]TDO24512.1 hypothetical protein CLV32_0801 [Pedobacter duraquae]